MTAQYPIALALLFISTSLCPGQTATYSSIEDGNSLAEFCKESPKPTALETLHRGMCAGYIVGVKDAEETTKISLRAANMEDKRRLTFCVDQRVTNGQLLDVVNKFLKDHPEVLHLSAAMIIDGALARSFPCK
jgi:hypothetical protein